LIHGEGDIWPRVGGEVHKHPGIAWITPDLGTWLTVLVFSKSAVLRRSLLRSSSLQTKGRDDSARKTGLLEFDSPGVIAHNENAKEAGNIVLNVEVELDALQVGKDVIDVLVIRRKEETVVHVDQTYDAVRVEQACIRFALFEPNGSSHPLRCSNQVRGLCLSPYKACFSCRTLPVLRNPLGMLT
jgi:hypothetical protein